MMNLKKLVPPLELCKLIPEGEFADSYFVYMEPDGRTSLTMPHSREYANATVIEWRKTSWILYPAPTLQEIIKELDEFEVWGNNISDEHTVVSEFVQYEDENTATAALKVWLKLKGIEA